MLSLAFAGDRAGQAARRLMDPLLAVVFPARCPGCTRFLRLPRRGPLCDSCWAALPRHDAPLCPCGAAWGVWGAKAATPPVSPPVRRAGLCPDRIAPTPPCPRCRRGLNPIRQGASLGPYEGPLRLLVHELKYRGKRAVATRLAEELLAAPSVRALLTPGCVVVPVPLHPRRLRARGFNQSELLARALARRAGCSLVAGALVRRTDTPPQTGKSAAERRANLRDAFVVRRRAALFSRTVILVDDVLTTGSTARACARALREAGVDEVRLLTAARVL